MCGSVMMQSLMKVTSYCHTFRLILVAAATRASVFECPFSDRLGLNELFELFDVMIKEQND